MPIDYYAVIKQHAAGGSPTSEGGLHEELWDACLRRTEPQFHNVRLARGDGGIDGIVFVDPVNAKCEVYQAKFYPELSDDKGQRKKQIVKSFATAMGHSFNCERWYLLVPKELKKPDLNWLMSDLRTEAVARIKADKKAHPSALTRAQNCAIEYKDDKDLDQMLRQNLDLAARLLPESHLALMEEVRTAKAERDADRTEMLTHLRIVRDEAIRRRVEATARARAAMAMLNQGWFSLKNRLDMAGVDESILGETLKIAASAVEAHARTSAGTAFEAEGLVPGVSGLLADVLYMARVVQTEAELEALDMADDGAAAETASKLASKIEQLQQVLGDASKALYQK